MDPSDLRQALDNVRPFSVSDGVRAFYRLYAHQHGKSRYGDKTPGYARAMPSIRSLLPEIHFIHIIRDGRDVALSLRKTRFAPSQDIVALARHWKHIVSMARANGRRLGNYHELRYEDLLSDSEKHLRVICEFLHLDFAPCMLDYWQGVPQRLAELEGRYRPDGSVLVPRESRIKLHELTTHPPQILRAGAWRHTMSDQEAAAFYKVAGKLLSELGYGETDLFLRDEIRAS